MTCRTLEEFYHIDGHTFEKQYKETLSGFREWDQLEHAEEWLLFPDNIGPRLAIDESSLSNGELYTFVTNRDAGTREQSLVAVVAGTKSEDVITVLQKISEEQRHAVKEVTLDLSDSMRKIVRTAFPKVDRVIDRFHIQKLACDAVQELRVKHRWAAIQQANDEQEEAKLAGESYEPFRYPNGDTRKELLIRSRYLLFKSADKWTERQKTTGCHPLFRISRYKEGLRALSFAKNDFCQKYNQRCSKAVHGQMVQQSRGSRIAFVQCDCIYILRT